MEPDEAVEQRLDRMQVQILDLTVQIMELRHSLIKVAEAIVATFGPVMNDRPCPMEEH